MQLDFGMGENRGKKVEAIFFLNERHENIFIRSVLKMESRKV